MLKKMYPGYPEVSAGYIRGIRRYPPDISAGHVRSIRRYPDRTKKNLHQISHRLVCLTLNLDGVRIFVPDTYPGFSHTQNEVKKFKPEFYDINFVDKFKLKNNKILLNYWKKLTAKLIQKLTTLILFSFTFLKTKKI